MRIDDDDMWTSLLTCCAFSFPQNLRCGLYMEKGKAVILVSVPARFARVSMLFGFMDVSFEVFPRYLAAGREIWSGRICLFLRPHIRLQVQRSDTRPQSQPQSTGNFYLKGGFSQLSRRCQVSVTYHKTSATTLHLTGCAAKMPE